MRTQGPVYRHLARLLDAYKRCKANGNEFAETHKERIEQIVKNYLPSGSGFDSGTKFDLEESTPNKLIFLTSFHHMNDGGMYDGWSDHTVTVIPNLAWEFDIKISGRDRNDIKEFMADTFHDALHIQIDPYAKQ